MKTFIKYSTLVATGLMAAACGTLPVPSQTGDCQNQCDRNYSVNNVEAQRCAASCKDKAAAGGEGVAVLPSDVERPGNYRQD